MKIGIVDTELMTKSNQRFPNLACMKLSAFFKSQGHDVVRLDSCDGIDIYDKIYVSKVFTDTITPPELIGNPKVVFGGTGFHYDKYGTDCFLQSGQEHVMPDYSFYDSWSSAYIADKQSRGKRVGGAISYYTNASIGFLTRGCFRRCKFCVNRNSRSSDAWSPPLEFIDTSRKVVCLLDDNFLACKGWEKLLDSLCSVVVRHKLKYEFKQGIDIRLMTDAVAAKLSESTRYYRNSYIFAFDRVSDTQIVERGLSVFRQHIEKKSAFAYILCGYDSVGRDDIVGIFHRLVVLWEYRCLGYLMVYNRDERINNTPYEHIYKLLASWLNQFKTQRPMPFRVYCNKRGAMDAQHLAAIERMHPDLSDLFDMSYPYTKSRYIGVNNVDHWSVRAFDEAHPKVVGHRLTGVEGA